MFVYSGAGMEHWVEDVLASLDNQSLVTVEASYGIALLEGHHHHHEDEEEAEHEHEDEHEHEEGGGYDPHVWLSPLNAKREMENIKNAIAEADRRMRSTTRPTMLRGAPGVTNWTRRSKTD